MNKKERIEERIERRKQASFSQLTTTINQSINDSNSFNPSQTSINQSINQRKKVDDVTNNQSINHKSKSIEIGLVHWLVGWWLK